MIWTTRKTSQKWLDSIFVEEANQIEEGFVLHNECVRLFEKSGLIEGESEAGVFCRLCAVCTAKSSHFLLALYSMAMDGLAQESGAALRPLIETYELLIYLRLDTSRVYDVINSNKPSAGKIAKSISGDFMDLRAHLNRSASHFNLEPESVRHLFAQDASIKALPTHSKDVFERNLAIVTAFQVFIAVEAARCLLKIRQDADGVVERIEYWRRRSSSRINNDGTTST